MTPPIQIALPDPPEEPGPDDSPFGDLIYAYSRAQALADGLLLEVSQEARQVGFRYPVAVTLALHERLTPSRAEQALGQSLEARLWDVLWVASLAARLAPDGSDWLTFRVSLAEVDPASGDLRQTDLRLRAHCGPGDRGEPVVTIGFPEDF